MRRYWVKDDSGELAVNQYFGNEATARMVAAGLRREAGNNYHVDSGP